MVTAASRARTRKGESSHPRRAALRALALAGMVGLSLLASACGGSSGGAKVAQVDTNESAKGSGSSNGSGSGDPRAYSACMRSHGVPNFPDPDSNGRIKITSGRDSGGQLIGMDVNSPQFKGAARACQKLLPNGGRPTAAQRAKEQQAMLQYAQCMRSHGVPKFPDPKPGGALVIGKKAGVDPNSPEFKAAQQTCQQLVPGSPIAQQPGGGAIDKSPSTSSTP
jgi:hypothetical protein